MESSSSSKDLSLTGSNYCFVPNPLSFDFLKMDIENITSKNDSNMLNIFSPNAEYEPGVFSHNCKPDPDCVKMFVGQIPQSFSESDLLQLFYKFGNVYELRILKDKITGKSKGCCFVTFFTRRAALNAQNALHNIKVLPGMHHPIQMKPADSENRNDRKLFVGMLSRKYTETDVRSLFSPYGAIEECTVLRDASRQSKGCAFVTYMTRQSAQNAVKSMHHCHIFEGCSSPMVVKFADTQKDKDIRRLYLMQSGFTEQNQFSSISQSLFPDSAFLFPNNFLQQLQIRNYINSNPQFSIINHLNLPTVQTPNRGTLPIRPANIQSVTNTFFLNQLGDQNIGSLMMNEAINLNNIFTQLSEAASLNIQPLGYTDQMYPSTPIEQMTKRHSWDKFMVNQKQIEGPDGANLFVYHLPHEFSDQKLSELFKPYGRVLSAKVFIDKVTNMSKGFGFVSYDNVQSAKFAILKLNGFNILGKKLKVEVKKKKQLPRS